MFEPVIKWSGSKRSQASEIISNFPKEIDTYYESFCGGCSVIRRLLSTDTITVKHFICNDLNTDLIELWKLIKYKPIEVALYYEMFWNELNKDNDIERKKQYFEEVRTKLNVEHNPLDFMCIMRTTTNGMPRYNSKGEFNNSFHVTRNGINPSTLEHIIYEWSALLKEKDVEFTQGSYLDIRPNSKDYMYLDPPYANTKGMYYGKISTIELFDYLRSLPCKYSMSYDGISGNIDNTYAVPEDVYTKHIYIKSGNSSFKRTIGKSNNSIVFESLYIKEY